MLVGVAAALFLTLSPHNTATHANGDRAVNAARKRIDLPIDLPDRLERRLADTDVLGNVLLFVPIGFVGVLVFPRHPVVVAVGGSAASLAIEVTQKYFLPGRNPSWRDVKTNSLGCVAGVAAGYLVVQLIRLSRRRSEARHA